MKDEQDDLRKGLLLLSEQLQTVPEIESEHSPGSLHNLGIRLTKLQSDISNAKNKNDGVWHKRFDLFDILGLTRHEGIHSNVLAWLLDPEKSHNLGDRFLKGLFRKMGRTLPPYTWISVHREYRIDEDSRLDILVCTNHWFLAIENKIDAEDGDGQLDRYYDWLSQSGKVGRDRFLVYLSPDKRRRSQASCVSYGQIRELLTELHSECIPNAALQCFLSNITNNICE